MQKSIPWSYRPYKPFLFESGDIYVCRIAPEKDYVHFEWLGDENSEYTVYFGQRDSESYAVYEGVKGCAFTVSGLETDTDYKFYIEKGSWKSRVRLARTGAVPGTVINYLHPEDKAYSFSGSSLCSPSFVRHPDGYLLSSMDVYEGGAPQNLTLIFRSDDDGKTWRYVTDLFPCFWGKLFVHKGEVYMFAISNEYGDLLIGKSTDGGMTFPAPSVLLRGSCHNGMPGVHKNPQNVLIHNGRIYLTCEWGAWRAGYHAAMIMSCDADDDLLDCDNWSITPPVKYDESWEGVAVGPSSGCIEGTPVIAPSGKMYNIMRYDTSKTVPNYGLILAFEVDTEDHTAPLKYSHAIKFPGNLSKFMIQKDEKSGYYYSLIARITDETKIRDRSLLSLMRSNDLENWELCADILDARDQDHTKVGFNYIAFEFEGDDIIFQSRTAINNSRNFHDANYATFHRIKNFRELKITES